MLGFGRGVRSFVMRASAMSMVVALGFATVAAAEAPKPGLRDQMDPVAGVRFGVSKACLPAVRSGSVESFGKLVPHKKTIYPGQTSYWVGPDVTISTNGKSCTVRSIDGRAEALRQAVLESLQAAGAAPASAFDSGAGGQDSAGLFRQERYCMTLDGRPAWLLMSTSATRGRIPLQATMALETDGRCGRPAPTG